jgi:NAD(P)-dependent dehydrogenase (short-subunit alcohol dehydrogenase family)
MGRYEGKTALVTGATSGLGYAAAQQLAAEGWSKVIVTGRTLARVQETVARLAAETRTQVFTPLELDLNTPTSVQSAVAELVKRGGPIDFLLLNAGMIGVKRVLTAAGIEEDQAPLIGHHQLTVGLLGAGLVSPGARIVIAGSEAARGDVPMMSFTDVAAFASQYHQGDRTAAVEALMRSGPNVKYGPNRAYADAKLVVAWWAAALARRLPSGMAVYAVSPGSTPDTQAARNAGWALKWLLVPMVKLLGMVQTPEVAARRYLQAAEFGTDVSGQFFASAPKKLIGPIEAMRHPPLSRPRQPGGGMAGGRQRLRRRPAGPDRYSGDAARVTDARCEWGRRPPLAMPAVVERLRGGNAVRQGAPQAAARPPYDVLA